MATTTPTNKVVYSGITGALVTLIVIILNTYVLDKDKQIPAELSSAATTVLSFIVGYQVPHGEKETITGDRKSGLS